VVLAFARSVLRQPALRDDHHKPRMSKEEAVSIFTVLFIVLLLAWILGFGVFHVASALIHILLIVAVISLILHFVRGGTRTV